MRPSYRNPLILFLLCISWLLPVSCAKKAVAPPEPVVEVQEEIVVVAPPDSDTAYNQITEAQIAADQALAEAAAEMDRFVSEAVYFDFDSAALSEAAQMELGWKAEYMERNPDINIVIQGNCDDRGTVEYNLALGERRAQAAKIYLVDMGIDGTRIRAVSFGEENPVDPAQNEVAWAKNRRDDFVIE